MEHDGGVGTVQPDCIPANPSVAFACEGRTQSPRRRTGCPRRLSEEGRELCLRAEFRSLVHRYYDPTTEQFLSVDPAVGATGAPYRFAGSDPVNLSDPSGLCNDVNNQNHAGACTASEVAALKAAAAQAQTNEAAGASMCFSTSGCGSGISGAVSDFAAGLGDTLTGGLTHDVRGWIGSGNSFVNNGSGWYTAGKITGVVYGAGVCVAGGGLTCTALGIGATSVQTANDIANNCGAGTVGFDVGFGVLSVGFGAICSSAERALKDSRGYLYGFRAHSQIPGAAESGLGSTC